MKKSLAAVFGVILAMPACLQAQDLMQVYRQALHSDPTYLQAVAQHASDIQNVPIARAAILPSAKILGQGVFGLSKNTGTTFTPNGKTKSRQASYDLQLTQTLFDMSQFDTLGQAKLTLKGNDATYSAAIQDLMSRVANAYFAVLKAKEDVRYSYTNMASLKRQLEQAEQQYRVGLKTRSDVDLAQSSYDNAAADHISKINDLSNAREDLRAITGVYYQHLSVLRQDLPLISPFPANIDKWVDVATHRNWTLIASRYAATAARKGISVAWDDNLPTLSLQADYDRSTQAAWPYDPGGPTATTATVGPSVTLNLTVPIVSGGLTSANTRQAEANFQVAQKQYEYSLRDTINQTRQSYLTVLSGISQIKADRQAVISGESALRGALAGYRVGTKTIVEVLKAQDTLFQAQTQYAEDRFNYVTNSIKLKEETGTLSVNDLMAINNWLTTSDESNQEEAVETQQPTVSNYQHLQRATMPTEKPKAKPSVTIPKPSKTPATADKQPQQ